MTEEKFRQIITEALERGETGIIIWKNPQERIKRGVNEEKIFVDNAFDVQGYDQDGEIYGEYRKMGLISAIQNYFKIGCEFKLMDQVGEKVILMAFQLKDLLYIRGQLSFAYKVMTQKHLNGPIVLFPSCQVVEY